MERIAYDCIGCKKCWGADAIIQLANHFDEVLPGECSNDDDSSTKQEYVSVPINGQLENSWPPHPGEYNLLANPHIRWLLLCGVEAPGHRAADAFLRLKERGVDANMRVLESASWRPVLKNLTLFDVARFREQIELVNLIGVTAVNRIVEATHEVAKKPTAPLSFQTLSNSDKIASRVERLQARAPKTLRLDKAGFFVVLPQAATDLIVCEHYENSGR